MIKESILTTHNKAHSQQKAATGLTLRHIKGTDSVYEVVTAIENGNFSDTVQLAREWQFQIEPRGLKQVEGKEVITAYT